jgi:hypothetical protein
MQDLLLQGSNLLTGAGSTSTSSLIPLQNSSTGEWSPDYCEFLITPPVLTLAQLPQSASITYQPVIATNTAGTSIVNAPGVGSFLQTGGVSGSPSPAPIAFKLPIPIGAAYWLGVQATSGTSTAATSATFTVAATFGKN